MDNQFSIFIRPSPHPVYIKVYILVAFALFVVLNSTVESFSFPKREVFAYQGQGCSPSSCQIRARIASNTQKFTTNGVDQVIELTPFVSTDGNSIPKKETNKTPDNAKKGISDYISQQLQHRKDPGTIVVWWLACFSIGFCLGYAVTKLRDILF